MAVPMPPTAQTWLSSRANTAPRDSVVGPPCTAHFMEPVVPEDAGVVLFEVALSFPPRLTASTTATTIITIAAATPMMIQVLRRCAAGLAAEEAGAGGGGEGEAPD